jgi:MSHA biogenesis protein MshK
MGLLASTVALPAAAEEVLPDPMRPPDFTSAPDDGGDATTPRAPLSLQSTLISGDRRSAVINGRSVHVGSTIEGAQVVAIGRTQVRLRDNAGVFTLRLPSAGIRRRVNGGDSG